MAVEIARSLEEIDNKVKVLNKTLRDSSNETKELDKSLRLDPKNTEAVAKKMDSLKTAVGTAAQKVALLKQKQDEANRAFARGDISAAEYKKIELSVIKAENEVKGLNAEIVKTQNLKADAVAGSFDKLTAGLNKAQAASAKLAKAAAVVLGALTAAATAFIMVGNDTIVPRESDGALKVADTNETELTADTADYGETVNTGFKATIRNIIRKIKGLFVKTAVNETAITAEAERARTAESGITAGISTEATRAQAAEQNLADGIAAETGRATQAEQQNETAVQDEIARAQAAEAAKVDKVTGKGLSTEDYTPAEKTKLAGLEKNHAKTTVEYGAASKTVYGHAKFYGNANGDSTELLANPTYEHFYNSAFDCNDYKTAGRIYQNHARSGTGATINGPLGNAADKFCLEVYTIPGDSATVLQRYISITNNREFVRKYSGTWSGWQEFAFKSDIASSAAIEAMTYKGVWSATATYKKGDAVVGDTGVSGVDALSTWVSLVDDNINRIPPTAESDSYWRIIGSYGTSGFIGRCRYPEVYIVGSNETSLAKKRGLILTDIDPYNQKSIWNTLAVLRPTVGQITSEANNDYIVYEKDGKLYDSRGLLAAQSDVGGAGGNAPKYSSELQQLSDRIQSVEMSISNYDMRLMSLESPSYGMDLSQRISNLEMQMSGNNDLSWRLSSLETQLGGISDLSWRLSNIESQLIGTSDLSMRLSNLEMQMNGGDTHMQLQNLSMRLDSIEMQLSGNSIQDMSWRLMNLESQLSGANIGMQISDMSMRIDDLQRQIQDLSARLPI
ncbi:hypothetical protein FACS1894211_00540 [Clostridia bacterium]|nr:hypothetical protein FACS1894211_00540 [Clostridia bacterium]